MAAADLMQTSPEHPGVLAGVEQKAAVLVGQARVDKETLVAMVLGVVLDTPVAAAAAVVQ